MSGEQLDMFAPAPGLVRADHPDTARAAAIAVAPRTGTQRRAVLDHIARSGRIGATDLELQQELRLGGNSERPRRRELVGGGFIVDSGQRRYGHIVWVLAEVDQ